MTRFSNQGRRVPYEQSKLAQQNGITSARVGIIFTVNTVFDVEIDQADNAYAGIGGGGSPTVASGTDPTTGFGYGPANRARYGNAATGQGAPQELVVGGGWRSINVEQQLNVTQEQALGNFEIFETLTHNVASNTFTADKMALRLLLLSQSGVACFGQEVITSPRLNAYIYDPKERQRGYNVGYLKLFGLHIQTNRFSANVGAAVGENVTFRVDRIKPVKVLPQGMLAQLATLFPSIYSGVEALEDFRLPDISIPGVNGGR